MALSKTLTKSVRGFDGEVVANDVYFKVSNITGDKHTLSFLVTGVSDGVQVYSTEHVFEPELDGDNFIKQAYEHLKTLPEFADAIDC